MAAGEIPGLISQVHSALSRVSGSSGEQPSEPLKPAVSVKKSVTPEYIVCLEDGKKFKSLKRHLRTQYSMTPEQYREKWGLGAGLSDGGAELRRRPFAACRSRWGSASSAAVGRNRRPSFPDRSADIAARPPAAASSVRPAGLPVFRMQFLAGLLAPLHAMRLISIDLIAYSCEK